MNYKQATFLYQLFYVIGEGSDMVAYNVAQPIIDRLLEEGGYIPASKVLYDNDGEPSIHWESFRFPPEFDYLTELFPNIDDHDSDMAPVEYRDGYEPSDDLLENPTEWKIKAHLEKLTNI